MPITHEQAQTLIQLKMDQTLNAQESAALNAHLHDCRDCATYASEIKEVANILSPLLKRQWNVQPVPLSIAALTERNGNVKSSSLLAMRTAAMSLVMIAIFFGVWQFVVSSTTGASPITASIPPLPTPSSLTAPSTSTQLTLEDCALMPYTVQENDTLASIAGQFSISEEAILEFNQLETGMIRPRMELVIPLCSFTPTGTFYPSTFTSTDTPVLNYTPTTPNG